TRSDRDWSSDVCSSDLDGGGESVGRAVGGGVEFGRRRHPAGEVDRDAPQQGEVIRGRRRGETLLFPVVGEETIDRSREGGRGVEIGRASCRERGEGSAG